MRKIKIYILLTLVAILLIQPITVNGFEGGQFQQVNVRDWKNALSGPLWNYIKNITSQSKMLSKNDLVSLSSQTIPSATPISTFTLNTRVSKDLDGFYENEPSIAANPNNPNNLVIGTHQYTSTTVYTAAYRSLDGGNTWTGPVLLPLSKPTDFFASDPALTADRSGTFYYSYMSIGLRNIKTIYGTTTIFSNDIVVARSIDNGANWQTSIAVTAENKSFPPYIYVFDILFDKPYIASGPISSYENVIVVSYTEFIDGFNSLTNQGFTNVTIKIVASFDNGRTWSTPISVSPTYSITSSTIVRIVQGSIPAVGPDGTIYVAYYDSGEDGWLTGHAYIMVARSLDNGRTFNPPVVAAVIPYELSYFSGPIGFRWWSSMFPSMSVGPDGNIYIVYAADPDGPGGDPADIFLVKSIDKGLTWSAPLRVNDDNTKNAQFFPWVSVDPRGVVHIIWGDRRLDPVDFGYDVYYANSTDGVSFSRNVRVTDYTNNILFGIPFFIGDYFNVVATSNNVHVVWTDTRRGLRKMGGFYWTGIDESIYTAKLGSRPSPILNVTPNDLQSGQTTILKITGANLPAEAPFTVYVDNVQLETIIAFTDIHGTFNITAALPITSVGNHKLTVNDFTTGLIIGDSSIIIKDYTAQTLLDRLNNVMNIQNSIMNKINDLSNSISVLQSQLSNSTNSILSTIDNSRKTILSAINDAQNNILNGVNNVKNALDTAKNVIITTINNSQSTILDNVRSNLNTVGTYLGIPLLIVLVLEVIELILIRKRT
jgi:hypothetical protein